MAGGGARLHQADGIEERLRERAYRRGAQFVQSEASAAERDSPETDNTAKTTEEAQNLATLKLGITADYSNMNVNVANMVNKEIESAKKIFGLENFEGVKVATTELNAYAIYDRKNKTVYMQNVSDEDSLNRMKQDAKKQYDLGFWSTNCKEHSPRHEIAHHLFHQYTDNNPVLRDKIEKIYLEKKREILNNKVWSMQDFETMKIAKLNGISYYALENLGDFGAECIAEYMSGNPREIARIVCEMLIKERK